MTFSEYWLCIWWGTLEKLSFLTVGMFIYWLATLMAVVTNMFVWRFRMYLSCFQMHFYIYKL